MALTITNHQIRSADTPLGLTGPRRHYAGIRGDRGRVMAWPAAGYGVVAAAGLRGDEDEQA
jgi:hypothetical protein